MGRRVSGSSSFRVVEFWGRQVLGSLEFWGRPSFGVVRVLGASSFEGVKFRECRVSGASSFGGVSGIEFRVKFWGRRVFFYLKTVRLLFVLRFTVVVMLKLQPLTLFF